MTVPQPCSCLHVPTNALAFYKTGDEAKRVPRRSTSSPCLQTTAEHHTPYIILLPMGLSSAGSTLASGLGHPPRHDASSKANSHALFRLERYLTAPSRALVKEHEPDLRVYSTGDGPDVYEDEFMKVARPDGEPFHPTLILVGTRLGIDKITPVYWEALIAALQLPQSVGIAGYVACGSVPTAPRAN